MLADASLSPEKYRLRLYIAHNTPQSAAALRNLKLLCEEHLPGRYHIEVIDLAKHPELAQRDQIIAVPTLVRELPSPIRKFIGSLANPERVLVDFHLEPSATKPSDHGTGEAHGPLKKFVPRFRLRRSSMCCACMWPGVPCNRVGRSRISRSFVRPI